MLAFRDGTPYQGEDLFYDAATPERFLVRCTRTAAAPTPGQLPARAAHRRRRPDACAFRAHWLDDWREVAAGIDRLIASLQSASAAAE